MSSEQRMTTEHAGAERALPQDPTIATEWYGEHGTVDPRVIRMRAVERHVDGTLELTDITITPWRRIVRPRRFHSADELLAEIFPIGRPMMVGDVPWPAGTGTGGQG